MIEKNNSFRSVKTIFALAFSLGFSLNVPAQRPKLTALGANFSFMFPSMMYTQSGNVKYFNLPTPKYGLYAELYFTKRFRLLGELNYQNYELERKFQEIKDGVKKTEYTNIYFKYFEFDLYAKYSLGKSSIIFGPGYSRLFSAQRSNEREYYNNIKREFKPYKLALVGGIQYRFDELLETYLRTGYQLNQFYRPGKNKEVPISRFVVEVGLRVILTLRKKELEAQDDLRIKNAIEAAKAKGLPFYERSPMLIW